MSTRTPSFATVLERLLTKRLSDVHTAMPGSIESFDAAKQTANVRLLLKARREIESGDVEEQELPVAVNVPVVFPGAGDFRLVFPLAPGDGVLIVFAEASIDRWQALGGLQPTVEDRRFHLSDAVAIPGLKPDVQPWAGVMGDAMTLGHDSGPGVVLRSTQVELGARDGSPATEAVVLGTAYRAAEDAAIDAAIGQLATALGAVSAITASLTTAIPLNAVPIVGGVLAVAPLTVIATQLGVLAGALGAASAALTTFKAAAATTLSSAVKTR